MLNEEQNIIEKSLVADNDRVEFLPHYCGSLFAQFEAAVFSFSDYFCKTYRGGYWEFYTLSNGGFFMELASKEQLDITNPMNYYSGALSPEAFSIGVNLFALNTVQQKSADNRLAEHYYALRDFAIQHEESSAILAFID